MIHREIHVENNQSLWMLNGRHCNQKNVEEEVKSLHIQVSNLCQFLPQVCFHHSGTCMRLSGLLKEMAAGALFNE